MFTQPMTREYDLNLGLILGRRHNFVIDTGLGSGCVAPVLEYIGDDAKPVIVINTHFHWDHIWGNCAFEDCAIIAHTSCRELADKYWEEDLMENSGFVDRQARKCLPNLLFEESLYFPDDEVRIFHSPGHTWDCISVYDAADNILYAGDNIGDTDDEIVPWIDTDPVTFRRLIGNYRLYGFEYCISGHNKPQKKAVLDRMESALEDAWKKQRAGV